jgi:protein-tyrosine phosphatase
MTRVLVVCTANLCRSPVMERLLGACLGNEVRVVSAGTAAAIGEDLCPAAESWLKGALPVERVSAPTEPEPERQPSSPPAGTPQRTNPCARTRTSLVRRLRWIPVLRRRSVGWISALRAAPCGPAWLTWPVETPGGETPSRNETPSRVELPSEGETPSRVETLSRAESLSGVGARQSWAEPSSEQGPLPVRIRRPVRPDGCLSVGGPGVGLQDGGRTAQDDPNGMFQWFVRAHGHLARQLTAAEVERADLILTAGREHRAKVISLVPGAQARTFTLAQAARIAGWLLEDRTRSESPGGVGGDAVRGRNSLPPREVAERLLALVDDLDTHRGAPPRPARAEEDDLPDPHEGARHESTFHRLHEHVGVLLEALER